MRLTVPPRAHALPRWTADPASLRPMLATQDPGHHDRLLASPSKIFERKHDGIRALVLVEPGHPHARIGIWSRNGHDKTAQFPDVVRTLQQFGARTKAPVVLDGEIVALDERHEPISFTHLGGRLHLTGAQAIEQRAKSTPAAFIVFDILRDGGDDLRGLPLVDRKARLERVMGTNANELFRLSDFVGGSDGQRLYERAQREQWEGLIAKEASSPYDTGKRSPNWIKIKLPREATFIVGGWTDPRDARQHFGALLVGDYEGEGRGKVLRYLGSVGTGFSDKELARVASILAKRAVAASPFTPAPKPPERPHWVTPDLRARVKFTELTKDGMLRHPVYLGLVTSDETPGAAPGGGNASRARATGVSATSDHPGPASATAAPRGRGARSAGNDGARHGRSVSAGPVPVATAVRQAAPGRQAKSTPAPKPSATTRATPSAEPADLTTPIDLVCHQLQVLENAKRDGRLVLPGGDALDVTNLAKVFWPGQGFTKGDLLRYYARVSPLILPAVTDRPLVMKRYPNGVSGKAFYQHRAPDDPPKGLRVAVAEGDKDRIPRIIGGSQLTLLYMTQLASISQDPWFSTIDTPHDMRDAALDLDPMPGVPFSQVREVARAIRDVLHALEIPACAKTSGSSGLHIYIPMTDGTPYEAAQTFCRIIATVVATQHPTIATVERSVGARGRKVYIDYLQNIEGKTLATAYAVRANDFAGVSTPLRWEELDSRDLHPEDFTLTSAEARFSAVGDLWRPMTDGPRLDLHEAMERMGKLVGWGEM